jgi:superfamily II DNA/RNA helicase
VNLHRSNVVLNYDTPWNATRLMQRIGRINRIGTTADQVHVFNFFPTAKVDADIELRKKALVKLQAFHSALGEDSQIYSTDEEVDSFGLFDRELEEERDESLSLLMELRKFRQQNPERFRQIRNLPLRSRVGRKDKLKDQATITFVRNKRRDGFYYLEKNQPVEELSFVEAARIFHANAMEKAIVLPGHHHSHVNQAVEHYHESLRSEAVKDQIVDNQIGPNERKALAFLNLFIQYPNLASGDEKRLLKHAQTAVRRAAFAKLQRDLNKLEKAHKKTPLKPAALLDKTLEIIDRYDLSAYADGEVETRSNQYTTKDLEPEIILSESFAS